MVNIKIEIDEESIKKLESSINNQVNRAIKQAIKDFEYSNFYGNNRPSKLDELIELLIEKKIIHRSEL